MEPNYLQFEDYSEPQFVEPPKTWNDALRDIWHDEPRKQRIAIDAGMQLNNILKNTPAAKNLYNISAVGFENNQKYINENCTVFNSITELPFSFKNSVREKVKMQLGVEDSKGLFFNANSHLSQDIKHSKEFRDFVVVNYEDLQDGNVLNGSLQFTSNANLYYALKRVAILDTYINKNGDIISFVFDTYDFNANDPDWKVEWARNVQLNGLLSKFYTINEVVVPKEEWMAWVLIYY